MLKSTLTTKGDGGFVFAKVHFVMMELILHPFKIIHLLSQ